jgi:hypothetical protein
MNNKIDIGNVLLVDYKDLPIDRNTRIGSIVVLLTSGDREAFSRGSPIEEELCRLRLPKHPCFARANLENCTEKLNRQEQNKNMLGKSVLASFPMSCKK